MNDFNPTEYQKIRNRLSLAFETWRPRFSAAAIGHVQHYLSVGELEMTLESLVLSALEENVTCPDELKSELRDLALSLGLDRESVFVVDFWKRAEPVFKQ